MQKIIIPLERDPAAKVPAYQSPFSAGVDVALLEDLTLFPGERAICPTGLKMAIPDGYEVQVRPRSGLSIKTSLRISNSPGTIDADYRNEIGIIVENTYRVMDLLNDAIADPDLPEKLEGYRRMPLKDYLASRGQDTLPGFADFPVYVNEAGEPYGTLTFKKGERIAQLVLTPVCQAEFEEVDDVSTIGHDRGGGFGSTGMI